MKLEASTFTELRKATEFPKWNEVFTTFIVASGFGNICDTTFNPPATHTAQRVRFDFMHI